MRVGLVVATLTLPLAGCQFIPGTDAQAISEAEKAVAEKMADPDSAKFRNERVVRFVHSVTAEMREGKMVPRDPIVCGEVNGKNRFGAYVGFTPFAYHATEPVKVEVYPTQMTSDDEAEAILSFQPDCLPKRPA